MTLRLLLSSVDLHDNHLHLDQQLDQFLDRQSGLRQFGEGR